MGHRIGTTSRAGRGSSTSAHVPTLSLLTAGLAGAALAEAGLTALRWSRHRQTRGRGGELWELARPELDLTMVVPYYNPGSRLRATVESLVEVLLESGLSFEVITVSDGSTDGSADSLAGVAGDVVRRVVLARNWGKGQALRAGLALGRGRYLGFIDADGDLPAELLRPFVSLMRRHEPDILLGSKRHPQSVVHYPPLRRAYSWGYQQLIRVLFHLRIRDTRPGSSSFGGMCWQPSCPTWWRSASPSISSSSWSPAASATGGSSRPRCASTSASAAPSRHARSSSCCWTRWRSSTASGSSASTAGPSLRPSGPAFPSGR
jgi:hypothetical protein